MSTVGAVASSASAYSLYVHKFVPIPVVARSKAWLYSRLLAGIVGSNPAAGHGCLSLLSVVCCQVEVYASG
jgi:hypothetical protein